MKVITKMELSPGMVLGEDVVYNGTLIYSANTKLEKEHIDKIMGYPLYCVTVMENVDFATTHYEKVLYDTAFKKFNEEYNSSLYRYKKLFFNYLKNGVIISNDELYSIYLNLESIIPNNSALLDYLYTLAPNEDELTFTQCLNSALLAGTFANWLTMKSEAKKTLVLSAFYYDIGKLLIPYDILWKPTKLTDDEYKLIKRHPTFGYEMVKNLVLDEHIKNAVWMHHEKMDGTGYPNNLSGDQIDIYARYISIIDSYTAMASPRSYRSARTPLQILGIFEDSHSKYDTQLLMPLMKRIADYQIGTKVKLNDDTQWEVLIIHPNKYSRPILKNDKNEFLDLLQRPELEIVQRI